MTSSEPTWASFSVRDPLAQEYLVAREASLALTEPLHPEDCVVQTIPEVSPTKWHLAHVTWFFEKFCLLEYSAGYELYNEDFHFLFNSYYYTAGEMHARAKRGLLSRPNLAEIIDYRHHVDAAMLKLIDSLPNDTNLEFRVKLGIQHEQQHQELLLTDIKHVFFSNPIGPRYIEPQPIEMNAATPLTFVERSGDLYTVGTNFDSSFCFDNETPAHEVLLGDHALGDRLVTNGEYQQFLEDGGYTNPRLWLADGWSRVINGELQRPLYWSADLVSEFTLSGWQRIDPSTPVCHLSFYEADAYARWAGARLPLESEWELAAKECDVAGNFFDRGGLRPQSAGQAEPGDLSIRQLFGDVWEWTSSPYVSYPRFRPLAGSLGEYNGKFMANQMVVRGGSCVTWASHIRATYRSFFYPHNRWQFLGLRLAKDL